MRIKKKITLTIRREMFLLSFISLFLASLVFGGIFFLFFFNSNLSNAKNTLHACNNQIVTYVEGMFHESANLVDLLARDQTVIDGGNGDSKAVTDIFDAIYENNSNITYIYSGYADGNLYINNYNTPAGYNPTDRPWYLASQNASGVTRLAYSDAATGVWLFSHCKKLVDESGAMVGAVCIDSSNENIAQQLSTKYQYGSQRSFITDLDGTVLIHPNEKEINNSLLAGRVDKTVWKEIIGGKNNYAEYSQHGIRAMAYFERIPNTDFFVVTAIDAAEIVNPILHSLLYIVLLVIGISLLLGLILSQILNFRIVRPIMELGGRIQGVASGKDDQPKGIQSSNAEINGIADSIEIIVRDIATREEQRKAAEFLSLHDSMTGLFNRRYFEEALQRLDTQGNYPLCIVSCDVNGLKLANDLFGHAVGDRLILQISQCLEKVCRIDDFAARVGGDEFMLVLPHTATAMAEQVLLRIKTTLLEKSVCGAMVSVSLGYAIKTDSDQPLDQLIRSADEMMYEHKRVESIQTKRRTVGNIIDAAKAEGLIQPLRNQEETLLDLFADTFCPDLRKLLKDSYRLRKIGLCSLILPGCSENNAERSHTENGYRILSTLDEYRGVAGCILHYTEHWDGSGWPAGLSGMDIPLLSRIISVTEGFCQEEASSRLTAQKGIQYDPELVDMLLSEEA